MWITVVFGIILGLSIGAFLGKLSSGKSGACGPLANPRRGALWGSMLGLILAASLSAPARENRPSAGAKAGATGTVSEIASPAQFERQVLRGQGRTVVDFYATWCDACKEYSSTVEQVAAAKLPGVRFARVDVDQAKELARRYRIRGLPTTVVFEKGQVRQQRMGSISERELRKLVQTGS